MPRLILSEQIGIPNKQQKKKRTNECIYVTWMNGRVKTFMFLLHHSPPIALDARNGRRGNQMTRRHSLPALS